MREAWRASRTLKTEVVTTEGQRITGRRAEKSWNPPREVTTDLPGRMSEFGQLLGWESCSRWSGRLGQKEFALFVKLENTRWWYTCG